jgi:NAD(P) transhydrogenase
MGQGRRAITAAFGDGLTTAQGMVPVGIYAIPELASVGLTEEQATEQYGSCVVGRAPFARIARGHISGNVGGLLKLVCWPDGSQILGVHCAGEMAAELVHLGQMAITNDLPVDHFVEGTYNFPTLAEAYRLAALEVVDQRPS